MISVQNLIALWLALVIMLGVGTVSYHTGLQVGHTLDNADAWNQGYVDGWNMHEKYGTCHDAR